jgi:hypothetical protein
VRILPEPESISTICAVTVVTDWEPVQLPVLDPPCDRFRPLLF